MRFPRRFALAVIAALAGGACAPTPDVTPAASRSRLPHDLILLKSSTGVSAIDVRSGDAVFHAPATSVVVPGFESLFTTTVSGGSTTLRERTIPSGDPLSEVRVDGELTARVVSGSGKRIALMQPDESSNSPYLPAAKTRTEIVVADTESSTIRSYELDGNFEPEAFSTDDNRLYLIEYLPAEAPERYRVRILQLSSGRVLPIGRLKSAAPEQMRGTGRTQILAPNEDVLYTLYTRQGPNRAHGKDVVVSSHNVYAFVHTLNLREGWAHCIDLPVPFGTGNASVSALATSPDGSRLFVADPSTGALAAIDPHELKVLDTAPLGFKDQSAPRAFATLSPSGDTLYVGTGRTVKVFDAGSLEELMSWSLPGTTIGLQTNVDGRILYVALRDTVLLLDADNGREVGRVRSADIEDLLTVSAAG